ncbi:MAG: glucokinase [Acidimicrobiaceae bacterium]|jgi:glucokinase|nr:glucokinase [Acidimicrobiaceae bacterium]
MVPSAGGAPQSSLPTPWSSVHPSSGTVLAIDIGGTKMAAALVDNEATILVEGQVPTPVGDDPEVLFAALVGVVREVEAQVPDRPDVCGVGCGGPMTKGGETVSPLNIPGWRGFELRRRLAETTGIPVAVDNDAKALALGEGWAGAARGEENFLAMVVSTGVGGGIVLGGELLDGRGGNAGHIGHVIVEPDGRPCACGGQGCLEAEASGPSIAASIGMSAADAPDAIKARTGTLVGRAVASVVNLLDLPLAVVAGSVALGFGAPFFAAAQAEMDERCRIEFARGARIVPAGLGRHGPLIGAAAIGRRLLAGDPA